MRAKGLHKILIIEPENTWDAFRLGQLYEITHEELNPGLTTESSKANPKELLGVRFVASELVDYLLAHP